MLRQIIVLLLMSVSLFAQDIEWEKLYGPPGGEISVFINDNQNNIPAGSAVNDTIWLIKQKKLTSGIYFYKLKSGSFTETKKMLLLQ